MHTGNFGIFIKLFQCQPFIMQCLRMLQQGTPYCAKIHPTVNEILNFEVINMFLNFKEKSDDGIHDNYGNSFFKDKNSNEKCIENQNN